MLYTVIKPNTYQDSVSLMLLSSQLSGMDEVDQVSIMMGTPANKDIFRTTGFESEEIDNANPADLVIAIKSENPDAPELVEQKVDDFIHNQASSSSGSGYPQVRSLNRAMDEMPDANLAVVSIPGDQAGDEVEQLLDRGLNVFLFSDNLPLPDEVRLKQKAESLGLMLMGPDCGTGSFSGLPMAFTNIVRRGPIGIVGASGTGTQEIMVQVDLAGGGISHAIGLGGRDLQEDVGAITCKQALRALDADESTRVITLVSKPPAPSVRKDVLDLCQQLSKPVVAILLGELPEQERDGNVTFASTLEEAGQLAVALAGPAGEDGQAEAQPQFKAGQKGIRGLFCGGTLASESAIMIAHDLGIDSDEQVPDGYMLKKDGHAVIDLGDDQYTQGRPHPMIDPTLRAEQITAAFDDPEVAVILMDVVTGYGSHEDPGGAIIPAIEEGREKARAEGREVLVVASVCGTNSDPQPRDEQVAKLEEAGVVVLGSNAAAVRHALDAIHNIGQERTPAQVPEATKQLVSQEPHVINMGLPSFARALHECGGQVVQYTWQPLAGGNKRLQKILKAMT